MKNQKALTIIQRIGYFALFLASLFNFINGMVEKRIFSSAVVLPLFAVALVGIVCGIVLLFKNKRK